MIPCWININF